MSGQVRRDVRVEIGDAEGVITDIASGKSFTVPLAHPRTVVPPSHGASRTSPPPPTAERVAGESR
jgi:hypothetical protein